MRPKKGFTLVELLIVVSILGVLATIALPRIMGRAKTAKINACKTNVALINSQLELYYQNKGEWPNFLTDLDDPNYFPDELPNCPFGTFYHYTMIIHRVFEHGH